jgi:hypothetical protein
MRECDVAWLLDHPEHKQAFLDMIKKSIEDVRDNRYKGVLEDDVKKSL